MKIVSRQIDIKHSSKPLQTSNRDHKVFKRTSNQHQDFALKIRVFKYASNYPHLPPQNSSDQNCFKGSSKAPQFNMLFPYSIFRTAKDHCFCFGFVFFSQTRTLFSPSPSCPLTPFSFLPLSFPSPCPSLDLLFYLYCSPLLLPPPLVSLPSLLFASSAAELERCSTFE